MRELTIHRRKSFVGGAAKIKFYIEDPQGDTKIQNALCRKLGELKNGQQGSFPIPEEACRIYAIADKLSSSFCCELLELPAGTEPVERSGQCRFAPAGGNPFRFDDNDSGQALELRQKGKRTATRVLIVAAVIGFILGFSWAFIDLDKEFSKGGMTITLTDDFQEYSYGIYDAVYESPDYAVLGRDWEYKYQQELADMTEEEFLRLTIALLSHSTASEIQYMDALPYYTYTTEVEGEPYIFYVTAHKGTESYWQLDFGAPESKAEKLEKKLPKWAGSVEVE